MNRRNLIRIAAALAAAPFISPMAMAQTIDVEGILNDPEAPAGGNPKGDVTIVAFLDYNCPYCKKSAPDLARVVREDGKIRLVYKEWPILGESSVLASQIALGAGYQGRYEAVHKALMGLPGRLSSKDTILAAVKGAGVDMNRLQADLDANAEKITAQLRRNLAQADSLGLQGTPAYLVGPFRTSTLDYKGFKQVVADARGKQAAQ
ncbi:DsbA family protein [Bosea sp. 2KB_26]|uniref:DsbA family protein n=1 Tax=Bosea sp. 2KB_26 TaxID=3237475 RepID=UPI000DE41829